MSYNVHVSIFIFVYYFESTFYYTYMYVKSIRVQWKLCGVHIAINYTPLSMAYYTYDSIVNLLFLVPTVLICISKELCCKEELCGVEFEPIIRKLRDFSEDQLNANWL